MKCGDKWLFLEATDIRVVKNVLVYYLINDRYSWAWVGNLTNSLDRYLRPLSR